MAVMAGFDDLQTIRDYLREEGRMIRHAPISFAIGVAIVGIMIFAVLEWHHSGEFSSKDATIANKEATIQFQSEQLSEYRNKLQVKTPDEAAKKLADLESKLKPLIDDINRPQRELTEDQKRRLIRNTEPVKSRLIDYWIYISSSDPTSTVPSFAAPAFCVAH
jgi:hypothetical protein